MAAGSSPVSSLPSKSTVVSACMVSPIPYRKKGMMRVSQLPSIETCASDFREPMLVGIAPENELLAASSTTRLLSRPRLVGIVPYKPDLSLTQWPSPLWCRSPASIGARAWLSSSWLRSSCSWRPQTAPATAGPAEPAHIAEAEAAASRQAESGAEQQRCTRPRASAQQFFEQNIY